MYPLQFKAKQSKNGEYGILHFHPGLESVPDLVLAKDGEKEPTQKKWFTKWLRCIICTGGFIWRHRFMELELRYSIMSWFPGQHLLDGCFHLTENKFRNWKPWRVIVGLGSWFLNIITHCFPIWILYPCVPAPIPTIHPLQKEKLYHSSLAKTVKTFTKISSQIYLPAPSRWPHFTTKKNVVQDKEFQSYSIFFSIY